MRHTYHLLYTIIISSLFLQSCLGTRYLQKNEYLLADQHVVGNKKIKKQELEPYYLQHTNRKYVGMPISLWIYELGKLNFNEKAIRRKYKRLERSYNEKLAAAANQQEKLKKLQEAKKRKLEYYEELLKKGNFLMRVGEPPVIYTDQKRISTENNLLQYLYTKGYFNARVTSRLKLKDQKACVVYRITENQPFIIKALRLYSPDVAIEQLLQPYEQSSVVKKGKRYDQDKLKAERERIYDLLLNNGYWDFNKQYITFNVDTTANNSSVAIETVVSLPSGRNSHPIYYLDRIEFSVLDGHLGEHIGGTITKDGIIFHNIRQHFPPNVIANKISLRPGQLYRKQDIIKVQKRLTSLGIFKDIHVIYDKLGEQYLKTHIHTSLVDKFQLEQELGTDFTNKSIVPFYQLSLKSRNLLKKLELLILKTHLSIEAGALPLSQQRVYSVQNIHTDLELNLPQFLAPLSASMRTKLGDLKPYTKMNVGYTFTNQPNYMSHKFRTLLSYGWQPAINSTYELTPLSVAFMDYKLNDAFKRDLERKKKEGDNSYKRYKSALLVNSAIKATFKNFDEHKENYSYLELLLESAGTLQNLIDFKNLFGLRLMYYKYLKFNITYSQHIPLQPGTIFAYNLNTGILYPYGSSKVAPPDKYYFIGGQSSIRAWGPRSLGPGSYAGKDTEQKEFFDERCGEFILQANAELRQHLVRFLEGAIFIDAGNVWMLHKTYGQGEDFSPNRFYKEIAIGIGAGVRLNFNFLVLRLDVGIKLYDPARPLKDRFLPTTMDQPTINLGLGYPF